jgi:hypothetical protein
MQERESKERWRKEERIQGELHVLVNFMFSNFIVAYLFLKGKFYST